MRRRLLAATVLLGLAVAAPGFAETPVQVASAALSVEQVPNANGRAQFDLSPDGLRLAYVVVKPKADGSAYDADLWLAAAGDPQGARRLAHLGDTPAVVSAATPRFSPDGASLAYLTTGEGGAQLVVAELQGGGSRSLISAEALKQGGLDGRETPGLFAWSPDGSRMAVVMSPPPAAEPTAGMETSVFWPYDTGDPASRLVVIEARSGKVLAATPTDLDVSGLSWAPDGRRLAVSASLISSHDRFFDQDIYLTDAATGAAQVVVKLEGVDSEPAWSPDGRRIAFATQAGRGSKDWLQILGFYDAQSGTTTFPARDRFEAALGSPHDFTWTSDGHLLFTAMHALAAPIFRLDAGTGALATFSREPRAYISGLSASRTGGRVAFSREQLSVPSELFVSTIHDYAPRQATRLNPDLKLPAVNLRVVDWPSRDGRWDLHGVLITPPGPAQRRPLVTLVEGGPQMVHFSYELGLQYPVHALVAAGYGVFVPNTRGRSGYSHAFRRALAEQKDYVEAPFQDLMSGVDKVVAMGEADPGRLGVAGFSYGAMLSAYALTRTDRFRAASINDASFDLRRYALSYAANGEFRRFWDDSIGFSDPFDPEDSRRMLEQSPLEHAGQITTPLLLESGSRAYGGMEEGVTPLYQALCRFGRAPARYVRYPRSGHGVWEPRLRLDSAKRNLDWFDAFLGSAAPSGAQGCPQRELR